MFTPKNPEFPPLPIDLSLNRDSLTALPESGLPSVLTIGSGYIARNASGIGSERRV